MFSFFQNTFNSIKEKQKNKTKQNKTKQETYRFQKKLRDEKSREEKVAQFFQNAIV